MRGQNALTHHEANVLLGDYVANELPQQTQMLVEQHLSTCELCQADYAEIRQIRRLLGTVKVRVEKNTASSLADGVLASLDMASVYSSEELNALLVGSADEFSEPQEIGENIRPLFSVPGVLTTESASESYSQKRLNKQQKKYIPMNNEKNNASYGNGRTYKMESHTHTVNKTKMNTLWLTLVAVLVLAIVSGSLFAFRSVLFGGHNNGPTRPGIATPAPKSTQTATPSPTVVTQQVPPTQTDCPANGTARAMVTAPLAQGKDPQIVYVTQKGHDVTTSTVMRYDTVTHTSTEILNPASGMIRWASLSADSQWLLIGYVDAAHLLNLPPTYVQLQAVRIDGQGLQTLYCGSNTNFMWSPDRHWIVFDDSILFPGSADTIRLIDTTTGKILSAVDIPQQDTAAVHNPRPAVWLSNTQLYLKDLTYVHPFNVYLLDTTKGEHQSPSSLQIVTQQTLYTWLITNGTSLFLSTTACSDGSATCSLDKSQTTLVRLPAQGGTPQTIFQDPQLFIDNISVMNAQNILVVADNATAGTRELWVVKSDGSSHSRIASAKATFGTGSGQVSPYAGSVIPSSDGKHFVVTGWPTADGSDTQICYGSSDSSALTTLDTGGDATWVLGWTGF